MNFYKRHLGDVAKSCSDLSQGQMGAYDLLLDWHYANEKPLPLKAEKLYLIGRARTAEEKANVDSVIEELFTRTPQGYTHKRAAEEMAKANAQAEANRIVAANREAKRRERIEHESLHGSSDDSCTNGQRSQTPDSNKASSSSQSSSHTERTIGSPGTDSAPDDAVGAFDGHSPTDVAAATAKGLALVEASKAIRAAGCPDCSASDAHLVQALADGLTVAELCDQARAKPNKNIAYLVGRARGQRADAAAQAGTVGAAQVSTRNPEGPSPRKSREQERADQVEALAAMRRQHQDLGISH